MTWFGDVRIVIAHSIYAFLAAEDITDFEKYRVDAGEPFAPTFFVPDDPAPPPGVGVTGKR